MPEITTRLRVNPVACSGHGVCADLLPELITLDEWGYPVVTHDGAVPARLARAARRAVTDCPALALALRPGEESRGYSEEAQRRGRAGAGRLGS